jgi:putative transposase
MERFMAAGPPQLPSAALLHEAFLWFEVRTVTKTASVSLHANSFEVDAALVGKQVELIFDPYDLTTIEVRFEGRPMGTAVPLRIGTHTHPKARPEAAPVPAPTGIDYLGLMTGAGRPSFRAARSTTRRWARTATTDTMTIDTSATRRT